MKITFQKFRTITDTLNDIFIATPSVEHTKFGYAVKRFIEKSANPILKDYNVELNDIRIDHALIDPTTQAVLTDKDSDRGYKYGKDGLKSVIKAENEFTKAYDEKEVEIEPYISKEVPELTEEQRETLLGILIEKAKK